MIEWLLSSTAFSTIQTVLNILILIHLFQAHRRITRNHKHCLMVGEWVIKQQNIDSIRRQARKMKERGVEVTDDSMFGDIRWGDIKDE